MATLNAQFWKKYFEVYDVLNELIPYQELLETIVGKLDVQPSDLILDAGSGTGNLAVAIEKKSGRVVGIDMSEAGVERHKKKIPNADVRVGDLTEPLPFPNDHFDKLCSNNVIYALPVNKRPFVFSEFYRVLKPGGIIVISNVHEKFAPKKIYRYHIKKSLRKNPFKLAIKLLGYTVPTIKMFIFNKKIKKEHQSGNYNFMKADDQKQLLEQAGFTDVSDSILVYASQAILNYGEKSNN